MPVAVYPVCAWGWWAQKQQGGGHRDGQALMKRPKIPVMVVPL